MSSALLQARHLRAEIEPLKGKYYGSQVSLFNEKGEHVDTLNVWVMGDYSPSQRELEAWDEDEFGPWEADSGHFESALGYEICQLIVKAVNGE